MLFFVANFLFPIFLIVICLGLGLFIRLILKKEQKLAITIVEGFALLISIGYLLTLTPQFSKLLPNTILAISLLGIFTNISFLTKIFQQTNQLLVLCVSYIFAAIPAIIYGKVSWAGWVQLDDTATFLAITDRIMNAGQTLTSTLQSTYDRVIHVVLGNSFFGSYSSGTNEQSFRYPIGSLIPIGTSAKLLGIDYAWIYLPNLFVCIALTAALFYNVFSFYFKKRWQIFCAALFAAQASTFYSYALWGGIKELTLVPIFLLNLIHLDSLISSKKKFVKNLDLIFRYLISAFAFYAIAGKTGLGFILGSLFIFLILRSASDFIKKVEFQISIVMLLSAILVFRSNISNLVNRYLVPEIPDSGNFSRSLNPFQILGVWPSGDFRANLYWQPFSQVMILGIFALSTYGIISSSKSKKYLIPVSTLSSLLIVIYSHFYGGIWLTGKAIAVASPFWLAAAFIGIQNLRIRKLPKEYKDFVFAGLICAVITSNFLSISHSWFAPSEKLQELAKIGKQFSGQGPALMTDYSVAGARYFLRNLDAEAASELRVHSIPMRDGTELKKGFAADIDLFDNDVISKYKLLVLKHTAIGSRPLFNYELKFTGKYYDVWQLSDSSPSKIESVSLGNNFNPAQKPICQDVQNIFNSNVSSIYAAERKSTYVVALNDAVLPKKWKIPLDQNMSVVPGKSGSLQNIFEVSESGSYEMFIGGSFGGELTISIDGKKIYKGKTFFEGNPYLSNYLTKLDLSAGKHLLQLSYKDSFWLPGANVREPLGPVYLTQETAAQAKVFEFTKANSQKLCGMNVDWLAWKVS